MKNLIPLQTGTFLSFDKTPIYYEVRGQGKPIVFIYGIACILNHWHHQYEYFSKTHQVITLDLRGHSKSGVPLDRKDLSIPAMAKDISILLRELGLKSAHFVGHSFGAPVLLELYEHYTPLMRSLTLINGFASNPIKGMFGLDVIEPFFNFIKSQYLKNPVLMDAIWKTGLNNPLAMWGSAVLGGFNLRLTEFKDIEIYARGVSHMSLSVFIPLFEQLMNYEGLHVLDKIKIPTLIIAGEKDFVTPKSFQDDMHKRIPHSEFFMIPYASHCSQLDCPEFINMKIEKFLAKMEE